MTVMDFAAAVFIGNMMTAAALFSLREFDRDDWNEVPGLAYAGWLIPLAIALLALI